MSGDSEEKTQEPTQHKLRKSREKGQVSASADFVTAMITLIGAIVVYYSASAYVGLFIDSFSLAIITMDGASNAILLKQLFFISNGIINVVAPLAMVLVLVAILANIVHKKGIPFSMHPIKPDMSRISFSKGLKKLFAVRNSAEFGVSMLRIVAWFATAIFIMWLWVGELISAPICGAGCLLEAITTISIWLFVAGCILLIISALVDLPMQVALFKRDQRMSVSEQKRERRDTDGSPEIKSKRRQLAMEDSQQGKLDIEHTPGLLLVGGDCVVEVRFKSGETPLPVVYLKASGEDAYDVLSIARAEGFPIEEIGDIVSDIYSSVGKKNPILQRHFGPVANALVKHGMV